MYFKMIFLRQMTFKIKKKKKKEREKEEKKNIKRKSSLYILK